MTQEALPVPSFNKICHDCPAIAGLADDARSIAVHERWPWYTRWVGKSIIFRIACHSAAKRLDFDAEDIRRVVLRGLLTAYEAEKRRASE